MEIQYFKHYSPCLNRDMECKVYGHAGKPEYQKIPVCMYYPHSDKLRFGYSLISRDQFLDM